MRCGTRARPPPCNYLIVSESSKAERRRYQFLFFNFLPGVIPHDLFSLLLLFILRSDRRTSPLISTETHYGLREGSLASVVEVLGSN